MKKLNKILIISVLLCSFAINLVLAADTTDCGKFWSMYYKQENWQNGFIIVNQSRETSDNEYSNFLSVAQQQKILTKDDLNTAMLNLKKYCCTNNLWWISTQSCKEDETFFNPNSLDSKYLFDHIFDVMVRRMSWLKSDKDIYTETNMSVDEKWAERREWINDKAEDIEWSDAQSIIDEYKKYWTKSDPRLGYDITAEINWTFNLNDQRFLEYVSWKSGWENLEQSKKVAEAIKNYDNWTLYDRYNNMCALTRYFYSLLNNGGSTNSDRNEIILGLSKWVCEEKMKAQIDSENKYVQLVMQRSSNLFMENYIEWYFRYMYDRSNKLRSLWQSTTDRWLDVIRAVPKLVKTCKKW